METVLEKQLINCVGISSLSTSAMMFIWCYYTFFFFFLHPFLSSFFPAVWAARPRGWADHRAAVWQHAAGLQRGAVQEAHCHAEAAQETLPRWGGQSNLRIWGGRGAGNHLAPCWEMSCWVRFSGYPYRGKCTDGLFHWFVWTVHGWVMLCGRDECNPWRFHALVKGWGQEMTFLSNWLTCKALSFCNEPSLSSREKQSGEACWLCRWWILPRSSEMQEVGVQ